MRYIDGLPVVNATSPLILNVTQGDISKADRKEPGGCVMARCCRRSLKVTDVRVHLGRVYIRDGERWLRYITPGYLRSEIVSFDRGGDFWKGEYELLPPQASKRTGKKQGSAGGAKTGAVRKRGYHITLGVRSHSPLAP